MFGIVGVRSRQSALVLCAFLLQFVGFSALFGHTSAQTISNNSVGSVIDTKKAIKRFALVIGNSSYRNVPSLKNTLNDAAAMATKLQNLGYDVLHKTDLDRRSMNEVISAFMTRVEAGSEALVYYSGHGVELNGSNYLLPIDIPALSPDQERMLRTEGSNLTDLLLDLESRSARVTLVILDACRDNPFRDAAGGIATRSLGATRGLGRVDPPRGTFVIFSAGVGEQAIDNLGVQDTNPNGLFTRKLLKLIDQNGLEIRPMVQKLRTEVRLAALTGTGRSQIPSYYDQLLGEFYFQPPQPKDDEITENSCDRLVNTNENVGSLLKVDLSAGLQACTSASDQFPNEIRFVRQLQVVQEQRMVQRALNSNQVDFSNAYMLLYPSGKYVSDVRAHVASLSDALAIKPVYDPPVKIPVVIPAPVATIVPQVDTARVLQTELKRLGCSVDTVDGSWGISSVKAMTVYNKITHSNLSTSQPTIDAVEALRSQSSRVCPIICGDGEKAVGNHCVAAACKRGTFLNEKGQCKSFSAGNKSKIKKPDVVSLPTQLKRAEQKAFRKLPSVKSSLAHVRSSRTGAGASGNCFTFNGVRQCE